MQNIQSIALRIKSDIVVQAHQVGCTPQEITALEESDFFEDAEAEIRAELAALRLNHRRAFRAATPRQPATRRTPRRHFKKKASGSGCDDDGPEAWSHQALDLCAIQTLSALSPTLRGRGWSEWTRYRGSRFLGPIPRIVVSELWRGEGKSRSVTLAWTDAETGRNGEGVVALAAHVLKISEHNAATRLARFLSITTNVPLERFRSGYVPLYARREA